MTRSGGPASRACAYRVLAGTDYDTERIGAAMTNPDITSKYEAERLRAAEQSQIVYLQGQIDELRRLLKEQTNKYNWAMEQVRKVESSVAQVDSVLDRHRQEVAQALDGYRRDIAALRKEVAGALIKIEESARPLREMQTQIQQLGDARKQDRDQTATWLVRIEALEERTRHWQTHLREIDDRYRGIAGRLDTLASADEAVRADVRKLHEDLQIEKQSIRRQAVEAQQLVADVRGAIEEHASRLVRLDEVRQHIELFAEQLPGQIAKLEERLAELTGEAKRIERLATERFLMNQERLEELRHQQEERLVALHATDEQHLRQSTAWLERVDGLVRELEQRLNRMTALLQAEQVEHAHQLSMLERRDTQLIEALTTALAKQAELIRAEQIEQGRVAPAQAG